MPDVNSRAKEVVLSGRTEFCHNGSTHQAVLQVLNRWRQYQGKPYYYSTDNFTGTEAKWDGVPLIFAHEHPDLSLVETDLNTALKKVQGKIVGKIRQSEVVVPGQPRLEATVEFDDPDLERQYKNGVLSLSTAFTCMAEEDGTLSGKVRPNHVLVFAQDRQNMPGDLGAMFLHKADSGRMEEEKNFENVGRVMSTSNHSRLKGVVDVLNGFLKEWGGSDKADEAEPGPTIEEETDEEKKKKDTIDGEETDKEQANCSDKKDMKNKQEEIMDKEMADKLEAAEVAITNKDTEIATLKEENAKLTELVNKAAKEKADRDWLEVKNQLPIGMIPKAEDEPTLRQEYENDPKAFVNKILKIKTVPDSDESGAEFVHTGEKTPNRGIGLYDYSTGKYV